MIRFIPALSLLAACASQSYDADPSTDAGPSEVPGESPTDGGGGADDPDGDDVDGDDGGGESMPDEPVRVDSDWQIVDQYLAEDGCNMADWIESREDGTLSLRGDADGFTITHNRGAETCLLVDDETYICDQRQDEDTSVVEDFGLDALLLLTLNAEGDLAGDALVMETTITADCEGADCWLVELTTGSMPCDSLLMVEAERAR